MSMRMRRRKPIWPSSKLRFFCAVNDRCGKRNIFGQEWWTANDYKYQLYARINLLPNWTNENLTFICIFWWYTFYFISSFEYKHERGIKINENKTNEMKRRRRRKKWRMKCLRLYFARFHDCWQYYRSLYSFISWPLFT